MADDDLAEGGFLMREMRQQLGARQRVPDQRAVRELAGATFIVRSHAHATHTFAIAKVRRIVSEGPDGSVAYEGYRVESSGDPRSRPIAALQPSAGGRIASCSRRLVRLEPGRLPGLGRYSHGLRPP